ncbi:MAG: protein translocase subunit SecF, partial [Wenzhouxiangellaceae bacterium]
MDIIRNDTHIDFMARRKVALVFSALLLLASIGSLVTRGLDFGLDFTGGTLIEMAYPEAPELGEIRTALEQAGYENFTVQTFGTARDIVIRLPVEVVAEEGAEISTEALQALQSVDPDVVTRRVEYVGPQIGEELANQGGLALIYALVGILLYVSFRFQWRFAVGAVAALVHDVVIVVGALSLFQVSFDLTVVAA